MKRLTHIGGGTTVFVAAFVWLQFSTCDATSRAAETVPPRTSAKEGQKLDPVIVQFGAPLLTEEQASRQKQAIARIKELGGRVNWGGRAPAFSQLNPRAPVLSIMLHGSQELTDEDLKFLGAFPHLQFLNLNFANIADKELVRLKDLRSLRRLHLRRTGVTDEGLAHLAGLTELQELWLENCNVTELGLVKLGRLQKLRQLELAGTQIDDEGLPELAVFKNLEELTLGKTPPAKLGDAQQPTIKFDGDVALITDAGLVQLKTLTKLRRLVLNGRGITDAGMENLKSLSQLKSLSLVLTEVTDKGVASLQKSLPKCKIHKSP